ncbi:MAG: protein phosphatase 2C domain-containing protein [Parachlamydia sp.]|nr:protein phosphatase 2C domain-containing protein [Parachlamydia sp.]
MLSNIYLSQRALKANSFRTLVVPQPYREGAGNIRRAWHGTAMRVYKGMQCVDGPKESRRSLTLGERIKHLAAGLLLLVPLINTLALLILRKAGVQRAPVYVPGGFVSRQWVPAPYAAPMLWAIDNREYRVETDPAVVRSKIEKETREARMQQEEQNRIELFSKQIEGLKSVQADKGIKGEIAQVRNAHFLKTDALEAGLADAQGMRTSMEDTYHTAKVKVKVDGNLLEVKVSAIFDGHGGKGMAEFAKDNFVKHLKKRLEEFNRNGLQDVGVWNALKVALVDLSRNYKSNEGGATANVCLQIGRKVWMANVGDSRAILIKPEGTVVQLTEDQKPHLEKYARGIEKRGHLVLGGRLDGDLGVARALGDHDFIGGASARPKITLYELPEDSQPCYLLQACDGIWDVASSDQVGGLAHRLIKKGRSLPVVAADIVKAAFQAGSTDNMTVMLRKL